MIKKEIDKYWDFENSDTKEYTHCFHIYPAMMIPQVAREILKRYNDKEFKVLFDPYCGTGTSLVEGSLFNLKTIGTDLNPLARLISKVKVQKLDIDNIVSYREKFLKFCKDEQDTAYEKPNVTNIDFWFKEKQIKELSIIKKFIDKIKDKDEQDFLLVPFSETLREVSLTRNSEFKLYRMEAEKIEKHNPKTFDLFLSKLDRNIKGYKEYTAVNKNYNHNVYCFNSSEDIPNDLIKEQSVDIIITSPPYGDSRTTVAYGQFSTLSNEWLGIENARKLDSNLMGGKISNIEKTGFQPLDEIVDKISLDKPKRAKEIWSFYRDYKKSIDNVSKLLKKDGIVAYVVGNRRVSDMELPTDEFTKYWFEKNGFKYIETIVRNIPNKRQPKLTSPTNKKGAKVSTMNNEYIVILKKE
jgi:site-specific DNA-methyltransferase (cytosine-N4-specific)